MGHGSQPTTRRALNFALNFNLLICCYCKTAGKVISICSFLPAHNLFS
ncbi:hypothetical protein NC652_001221 [Populus alba x Populus x berolinensis]|nr:hypothetical protein NC652_001221 [Populus alba x Populus x berolinensis]